MARDEAHLVLRYAHRLREVVALAEHALARSVERESFGRAIMARDRGARLHRVHDDAVVSDRQPRHVRRFRKGVRDLVAVAVVIVQDEVAGCLIVDLRCARLDGILYARDRRQDVDAALDRFHGIAGLMSGLRDHDRDGIADEAHLVGRQRPPQRLHHR